MCNECVVNDLTPVAGCECGCNNEKENEDE
jgi:hypothetical protein